MFQVQATFQLAEVCFGWAREALGKDVITASDLTLNLSHLEGKLASTNKLLCIPSVLQNVSGCLAAGSSSLGQTLKLSYFSISAFATLANLCASVQCLGEFGIGRFSPYVSIFEKPKHIFRICACTIGLSVRIYELSWLITGKDIPPKTMRERQITKNLLTIGALTCAASFSIFTLLKIASDPCLTLRDSINEDSFRFLKTCEALAALGIAYLNREHS